MQKEIVIILDLLQKRGEVNMDEFCNMMHITRKQLLYRIAKINDILSINHQGEILIEDSYISLTSSQRNFIRSYLLGNHMLTDYEYSDEEREAMIYILMFTKPEYISLQSFMSALKVGKTTVHASLNSLKNKLTLRNIGFLYTKQNGYYLTGSELELRKYLIDLINSMLTIEHRPTAFNRMIEMYHFVPFDYLNLLVEELAKEYKIFYVGNRMHEFIYIIIFLSIRIRNIGDYNNDHNLSDREALLVSEYSKEYQFSRRLFNILELEHVDVFDMNYTCAWILGITTGNYDEYTRDRSFLSDIVKRVMDRFELLSACFYSDRFEIFKQLYAHFRPAYYRMRFKITIKNELTERIKSEYVYLYHIVEESLKPFGDLFSHPLDQDEIAFFTMHFATIYANNKVKETARKMTAVVVCANGMASSVILKNELSDLLPQINILKSMDFVSFKNEIPEVDLIFTSVKDLDVYSYGKPVIQVNVLMDEKEKLHVLQEIEYLYQKNQHPSFSKVEEIMEVVKKFSDIKDEFYLKNEIRRIIYKDVVEKKIEHPSYHLTDLLCKENILFIDSHLSPYEVIQKGAKLLYLNNFITEDYVKRLLDNDPSRYVIAPQIALPHVNCPVAVEKIGISLIVLDHPIPFQENDTNRVKYIFTLAAVDHTQHISAMNELLEVIGDNDFYEVLEAKDADKVMEYLMTVTSKLLKKID